MRQAEALELAGEGAFDLAILDVNLGGGETSYPVADLLAARSIPFLFATGYSRDGLEPRFRDAVRLQKPYSPQALVAAAAQLRTGG